MIGTVFSALLNVVVIVNIIFGIIVVFYERKEPAVTWAWLMVIAFIPYVGFGIYLIFGLDSRKHKIFAEKAKKDAENLHHILDIDLPGLHYSAVQRKTVDLKSILHVPGAEHLNDLVYLNYSAGLGAFTTNNRLTLFHDGNAKFDRMLLDIKNAKSYVHLLYYIMHNDNLGRRVIAALAEKAREGVEVRLMVDGMGCAMTPKSFYQPLREAGGDVAIFLPPIFIRMNFRNHRKICVVDGKIGYVGGLNIGDEYVGQTKRFGFWRDTHIRIDGDAAKELEIRFISDYNFYAKHQIQFCEKYFPVFEKQPDGVTMQIVCSGPDTKQASIFHAYAKIISEADKNIFIQTPYFAPDESIFTALKIAALSGIDVRVIFPAHPDHPFVYWASLSFLGELVEAGVRCYKYEKGFIHSKLIVIDGLVSSAGTANMDIRSFKLNFEVNAFIYDRQTANAFEVKFLEDLNDCTEITREIYSERGKITKIRESVSRLISPLL
ncbi:MAG: cardiolipin synthase [Clostridiales bacterium]|nr:cardiolipin synthase [Clostridiales bacterium]